MPVSHISLTVSHLPRSCSFFLSALSPLGYRYIGQEGNQIAFGIEEPDFFICQETASTKAGAAHIAFSAPSRSVVNSFFSAAIKAGGLVHGEPAIRDKAKGYYSAAVLDFDGNSVEVVCRDKMESNTSRSVVLHPEDSHVLDWQRDVAKSTARESPPRQTGHSPSRSIINNVTTPTMVVNQPQVEVIRSSGDMSTKAVVGTILGAAAGAAVAYAMTKAEAQSTPALSGPHTTVYQAVEAQPGATEYRQLYPPPAASSHGPASNSHQNTQGIPRSTISHSPRPPSRQSHASARTQIRAIEAAPAPRSTRSTLIDTFIPPSEVRRYQQNGPTPPQAELVSVTHRSKTAPSLHRPSKSRTPSAVASSARTVTPSSPRSSRRSSRAPASSHSARYIPLPASKAPSTVISFRAKGSQKASEVRQESPLRNSLADLASVAPSDSVSQVGSKLSSRGPRRERR